MKPVFRTATLLFSIVVLGLLTACQTSKNAALPPSDENSVPEPAIALREGDNVHVTFPAAKQLDTAQVVRRDGKIVLPTFGETQAAGLTPAQLEKQILDSFGSQLVSKEVSVTIESAPYPIFINGAVLRPGKIESVRPITVLEAIMEAGGFDYNRANLKSIKIIRTVGAEVKTYVVDLRGVLDGQQAKPFYIHPSDIVYVPERFTLF